MGKVLIPQPQQDMAPVDESGTESKSFSSETWNIETLAASLQSQPVPALVLPTVTDFPFPLRPADISV